MSGLTPASVCPQNERRRDRPDSTNSRFKETASGSSDGDDPPVSRPREAGFIAWPLAAILFCVVVGVGTIHLKLTSFRKDRRECAVLVSKAGDEPGTERIDVPDVAVENQKHVIGAGNQIVSDIWQAGVWKFRIIEPIHPKQTLILWKNLARHIQRTGSIVGRFDHFRREMKLNLGLDQPHRRSADISKSKNYVGGFVIRQLRFRQKIPKLDFIDNDRAAFRFLYARHC